MIRKLEESRNSGSDSIAQKTIQTLQSVLGRFGGEPGPRADGKADAAGPVAIDTGTMQNAAYRDFVRYQSDLVKAMIKEQQLDLNALQYFQENGLPQIQAVRQAGFAGSALKAKTHVRHPSFGARNMSFDQRAQGKTTFERRKYIPVNHIITQGRQETAPVSTVNYVPGQGEASTVDTSNRMEQRSDSLATGLVSDDFGTSSKVSKSAKKQHWTKQIAADDPTGAIALLRLKPEPLTLTGRSKSIGRSPNKLKRLRGTSKSTLNPAD